MMYVFHGSSKMNQVEWINKLYMAAISEKWF